MYSCNILGALLLAYCTGVYAALKTFTLDVAYGTFSPDGFRWDYIVANNQWEYPIVVDKGDDVQITVNNHLNESTAIHWHGMFQIGTPWMDGAGMVSHCPIPSGSMDRCWFGGDLFNSGLEIDSLVYAFNVGNQTGTFWWHAHYRGHMSNGLRGPFIINDPDDPYKSEYDEDVIVSLVEVYHNNTNWLAANVYFVPENTNANEPLPEAGLIGGVGRYNCSVTQSANSNCANNNPLKVFNVVPGKKYRYRLINMAAQARYLFSIDGHNMMVIESDGVYTKPYSANQISIHSAQRYSFILDANQAVDNYWIRATMVDTWSPDPTDGNGLNMDVRAILRYQGATAAEPTTVPSSVTVPLNPFLAGELNGKTASDLPSSLKFNQTFYMSFNYGPPLYNSSVATINIDSTALHFRQQQYKIPKEGEDLPLLASLIANTSAVLPAQANALNVYNGQWVLISIQNSDAMEHPFHLHGHTFYILSAGNLKHQTPPAGSTLARRDTIQVPACVGGKGNGGETGCLHGFVNIAVFFDHAGVWPFHCHIDWHMAAGLQMTFVNRGDGNDLPNLFKNPGVVPPGIFDTCTNVFPSPSQASVTSSVGATTTATLSATITAATTTTDAGVLTLTTDPPISSTSDSSAGQGCSHDLCVAGASLNPNCDPCVDQVCQVDSTCCSSSWNSNCVSMVDQYCDFVC